ncbi:MAG: potassium-transporting ATPase subunit KdpC [Gammaproteobacteria bacterium]
MLKELRPALVVFAALTVVTGAGYPALVTLIGRVAFSMQVEGSVIERDGKPAGSRLLGQPFSSPQYFWSRPSATAPQPYSGAASSGSNLGPTNPALKTAVAARIAALRVVDPDNNGPVPVDLVTASASGLDPHISVAAAQFQVNRVARVRNLMPGAVAALVREHTEAPTFGAFGEARVNVLELNLALDGDAAR